MIDLALQQSGKKPQVSKHQGRIAENAKTAAALPGSLGIGHTRWATHGVPNEVNAHPHTDCSTKLRLSTTGSSRIMPRPKRQPLGRGQQRFRSETDTEIIVHLIEENLVRCGDLFSAVRATLPVLTGPFALLVVMEGDKRIIAAKRASPLVLAVGDGEFFPVPI